MMNTNRTITLAGCFLAISAAWFLAFLIPEPSRDVLIGPRSHWSERCAFVIVVVVACAAGRHFLSLRHGPLAVAVLGLSAPIGGFLAFMIGPGLVAGDLVNGKLDPRALGFLGQLVLFYLASCWYVILVLGPATAFALSRTLACDPPHPCDDAREDRRAGGVATARRSADSRYPM